MIFIQMTGLSGAGKTTIALGVKNRLEEKGYKVEVIDGDIYRQRLCRDLGYSKEDRNENVRRLSFIGQLLARNGIIAIMAAINPYESVRGEVKALGSYVKTTWIRCSLEELVKRDVKGLYEKALLPEGHPDKLNNFTGISDPYEVPLDPDLVIDTSDTSIEESISALFHYIGGLLI